MSNRRRGLGRHHQSAEHPEHVEPTLSPTPTARIVPLREAVARGANATVSVIANPGLALARRPRPAEHGFHLASHILSGAHFAQAEPALDALDPASAATQSTLTQWLRRTAVRREHGRTTHAATPEQYLATHPLRNKSVHVLACVYCKASICDRAMRAILLADTAVELYSTDLPPSPKVLVLLNEDRPTATCHCRIRDCACRNCGNVLGYHVSQPCTHCLAAKNNGHFWMFMADTVLAAHRTEPGRDKPLSWAVLTAPEAVAAAMDDADGAGTGTALRIEEGRSLCR